MKLVLLSQDLMIGSHLSGTAKTLGLDMVTVSNQNRAVEIICDADCKLLFVDLRLPGLKIDHLVRDVTEICSEHVPIVACGPHVHEAKLAAAREAGCDAVVTRGQFDRDAGPILGNLLKQRPDA